MALTVVFVRHGESTANVTRTFANRPGIPGDLTPRGVQQAESLATSLDDLRLTHVYTSPLPRASQTAQAIAGRAGLPLVLADALREYDVGVDEGLPYSGEHAWRWQRYEAVQRAWRHGDRSACHPGGESLADIEERFLDFMGRLQSRHRENDVVVAVGHGGLFHMMLPALFQDRPADLARSHTLDHTDRVVGEYRDGRWRCIQWSAMRFTHHPG